MKQILNGVVIATALALAAPVWAQAPAAAPTGMTNAAAPAKHKPAYTQRKSRGDQTTAQLNRAELARVQTGTASVPAPSGYMGQPNSEMGIPGAGQPSASSHAATTQTPSGPMPASRQVSPSENSPQSQAMPPPMRATPQVSPTTH